MNNQQICTGGKKDDGGKNRLDLIPPSVILALGRVMTYGAKSMAQITGKG